MKSFLRSLIVTTALAAAGCVSSISPFYHIKDVYFDPNLVGIWADSENSERWNFTRLGENAYQVVYTDASRKIGRFDAHLFKINGSSFLDVTPSSNDDDEENEIYKSHFVRTHTLIAVSIKGGRAQLTFLNPDWLRQYLARRPSEVNHTSADGEVVLTDTTENLQTFIRRHLQTPGAFNDTDMMFKREINNAKDK